MADIFFSFAANHPKHVANKPSSMFLLYAKNNRNGWDRKALMCTFHMNGICLCSSFHMWWWIYVTAFSGCISPTRSIPFRITYAHPYRYSVSSWNWMPFPIIFVSNFHKNPTAMLLSLSSYCKSSLNFSKECSIRSLDFTSHNISALNFSRQLALPLVQSLSCVRLGQIETCFSPSCSYSYLGKSFS